MDGDRVLNAGYVQEFLKKENCEKSCEDFMLPLVAVFGEGKEEEEEKNMSYKIRESRKLTPGPEELVGLVYHFLVNTSYRERIRAECYGCEINASSQIDHLEGCLELDVSVQTIKFCTYVQSHLSLQNESLCCMCKSVGEKYGMITSDITLSLIDRVLKDMWSMIPSLKALPIADMTFPYEYGELLD